MFPIFKKLTKRRSKRLRKEQRLHIHNHLIQLRKRIQDTGTDRTRAKKLEDKIIVIDSDSDESDVKPFGNHTSFSAGDSDAAIMIVQGKCTIYLSMHDQSR